MKVYNPAFGCKLDRLDVETVDGLPIYSDALEGLACKLKQRIDSGYQNVVLIIGDTGKGKSSLGIQLCEALDKFFTFQSDFVYEPEHLAAKLDRAEFEPVCPVTLVDEGSLVFNKMDYATKGGKDAVKLLDTIRLLRWTIVVCAPSLDEINTKLVAVHVDYLIDCGAGAPVPGYKKRGFFKVYKKKKYLFSKVWWDPLCWGYFRPLTPKKYAEYLKFKSEASKSFRRKYIERNGKTE